MNGPRLVQRILDRRLTQCRTAGAHTPSRCESCGIHEKDTDQ